MTNTWDRFNLKGKTAFVTGGGTGLGYYMSRGLARAGAKVMIASRREEVLKSAAEKITEEAGGNEVLYRTIDLSNRESIVDAAQHAIETLQGVDIFVGNAAQDVYGVIDQIDEDVAANILQLNLIANMSLTKLFLPRMRAKKWGRVIYSSSIVSIGGSPQEGVSIYGASKAGINSLARSVATEAGHDGITANSLVIGAFLTDMLANTVAAMEPERGQEFVKSMASMNALGRLAQPNELEGVIQFLASDAASYITGANIPVEGGWSIMLRPNMPQG